MTLSLCVEPFPCFLRLRGGRAWPLRNQHAPSSSVSFNAKPRNRQGNRPPRYQTAAVSEPSNQDRNIAPPEVVAVRKNYHVSGVSEADRRPTVVVSERSRLKTASAALDEPKYPPHPSPPSSRNFSETLRIVKSPRIHEMASRCGWPNLVFSSRGIKVVCRNVSVLRGNNSLEDVLGALAPGIPVQSALVFIAGRNTQGMIPISILVQI